MEKMPLHIDIERETLENDYYRRVIHTGVHEQLVLMSILPGESIPKNGEAEVHDGDQFIRIEGGNGVAIVDGKSYLLYDGVSMSIDAGEYHLIRNTGTDKLKLYTVYAPPEHPPQTVE